MIRPNTAGGRSIVTNSPLSRTMYTISTGTAYFTKARIQLRNPHGAV